MATESILAALDASVVQLRRLVGSAVLSDYWALAKPEISFLIAIATSAGFCLGRPAGSNELSSLIIGLPALAGSRMAGAFSEKEAWQRRQQ